VGENRIADAQMGSDCAAQKPRQQDRAGHGGARNRIDGGAGELEDPDAEGEPVRVSKLSE
jgi:hypothetical protein